MKLTLIIISSIVFLLIFLVTIGLVLFSLSLPQKKDFLYLQEPRIIEKQNVTALMADFDGDPNIVLKEVFGKVFKVYYGLKNVPKGKGQSAPVARYQDFDNLLNLVAEDNLKDIPWKGYVAIPVPESLQSIPDKAKQAPYPVRLEQLKYGLVAEIAHFGSYETEGPVIQKLKDYITEQGYAISGLHEEEYLKGPGLPFVSPKDYITIIRYQIKKN